MYEMVKDILQKFERWESEIDNSNIEVNQLKVVVQNLKEAVLEYKPNYANPKSGT